MVEHRKKRLVKTRKRASSKRVGKKNTKIIPPPEDFSENALHMHACQWLRKETKGLLIFHVPNGEHRHIAVAKKLQRMGVMPGVADFLCFTPNRKIAIELKDSDGKQSYDQCTFEYLWREAGGEYHLCRTLDQFKSLVTGIMLFYY